MSLTDISIIVCIGVVFTFAWVMILRSGTSRGG